MMVYKRDIVAFSKSRKKGNFLHRQSTMSFTLRFCEFFKYILIPFRFDGRCLPIAIGTLRFRPYQGFQTLKTT